MNRSSSCTDISLDSLEENFKNKSMLKERSYEEQVETILVPFYENDVLITVPKLTKEKKNNLRNRDRKNSKSKKESEPQSYLINKNAQENKKRSYLDLFRKQFVPNSLCKKKQAEEIRSTSPQVGDTEIGSLDDEKHNNESEFFNTEAYNDIYYEKLINQDMEYYIDQSLEELQLSQDLEAHDDDNNFKSVSEVTQPRREKKRSTAQQLHNMKLGGLGPDMENIRPRLERARSLQRYSEKVRMENRLRIYKKTVEADKEALKRQPSAKMSQSARNKITSTEEKSTYLINKTKDKSSIIKKIYHGKSKSASAQNTKTRENKQNCLNKRDQIPKKCTRNDRSVTTKIETNCNENIKKQTIKIDKSTATDDKQSRNENIFRPMEINFLVNIDAGLRPSSALRNLEEKHRQYQEKVKTFTAEYRND